MERHGKQRVAEKARAPKWEERRDTEKTAEESTKQKQKKAD